jgi:hypothetical protein
MAQAALSMRANFAGAPLQQQRASTPVRAHAQPVMAVKKVNSYDDRWAKGEG